MFSNSKVLNVLTVARRAGSLNLDLSICGLTEVPPQLFEQHQNIRLLNLQQNGLRSLPPDMASLQQLVEINLSNNQLETLPSELALCTNLKYIDLDNCPRMEKQILEIYNHSLPAPRTNVITRAGKDIKPLMELFKLRLQRGPQQTSTMKAEHPAAGTPIVRQPIKLNEWGTVAAIDLKAGRRHDYDVNAENPTKPSSVYEQSPTNAMGGKRCNAPRESLMFAPIDDNNPAPQEYRGGKRVTAPPMSPGSAVVGQEWGTMQEEPKPRRLRQTKSNISSYGVLTTEEARPPFTSKAPPSQYSINSQWGDVSQEMSFSKKPYFAPAADKFVDGAYVPEHQDQSEVGTKLKKQFEANKQTKIDLSGRESETDTQRRLRTRPPRLHATSADDFVLNHGKTAQEQYQDRLPPEVKAMRSTPEQSPRTMPTPSDLSNLQIFATTELPQRGAESVDNAITALRSGNGRLQFGALNDVRSITLNHAGCLTRKLPTLIPQVNTLVGHPNGHLAVNAMLCVQELCLRMGHIINEYVYVLTKSILLQANNPDQDVGEVGREVLATMAKMLNPFSLFPALWDACNGPSQRIAGWACFTMRESLFTNSLVKGFLVEGVTNTNLLRCGQVLLILYDSPDAGVRDLAVDTLQALSQAVPQHNVVLQDLLRQSKKEDLAQVIAQ